MLLDIHSHRSKATFGAQSRQKFLNVFCEGARFGGKAWRSCGFLRRIPSKLFLVSDYERIEALQLRRKATHSRKPSNAAEVTRRRPTSAFWWPRAGGEARPFSRNHCQWRAFRRPAK